MLFSNLHKGKPSCQLQLHAFPEFIVQSLCIEHNETHFFVAQRILPTWKFRGEMLQNRHKSLFKDYWSKSEDKRGLPTFLNAPKKFEEKKS